MTSKFIPSLLIITLAIALISSASSAPSEKDIKDVTENVSKNLTAYIIAAAVIVCVIIGLLCWTAAKGCCCLIKIGLLVACGLALFFVIFKGTADYKDW